MDSISKVIHRVDNIVTCYTVFSAEAFRVCDYLIHECASLDIELEQIYLRSNEMDIRKFIDSIQFQVVFKTIEDMNLYKLIGKLKDKQPAIYIPNYIIFKEMNLELDYVRPENI